ncbi:MAG TPA: DUF167 domain-containing protein [Planctomycetota bacterium]
MRIQIKVVPKSSRDEVAGWLGGRLKVRVSAPPERGKANAAVEKLLAAALDLPSSAVRVVAGATTPLKTVEIDALEDVVMARLGGSH